MTQQDFMTEQCAATNLKPLYLTVEVPSFYTWTSAVGFAKGKERLRNCGFFVKGRAHGPVCTLKSKGCFSDCFSFHVKPGYSFCQILLTSSHCLMVSHVPFWKSNSFLLLSASSRGHAMQAHVQGCWKRIHGKPWRQFRRWNQMWAGWLWAPWGFQFVCNGKLQSKWLGNPGEPLTRNLLQTSQFTRSGGRKHDDPNNRASSSQKKRVLFLAYWMESSKSTILSVYPMPMPSRKDILLIMQ